MKKNMGNLDRLLRFVLAVAAVALYYFEVVSGTLGIAVMVLAAAFLLTSFVGFCPLYLPFGLNTCKVKQAE
ncbi:YgaP family membrane protein [Gilvibacter sediminis]|uniref:YgaP family membrane protein n=1 Tax=Gilvibacter sediminis TaxID=379071 RepID=UPI00234FDA4A|nr:DUF2892 domain-containing protein [Gilvibacter sediminis]MDC7998841.1 DUF2892 domain-containing protein [Gilvibacter sediminis]